MVIIVHHVKVIKCYQQHKIVFVHLEPISLAALHAHMNVRNAQVLQIIV
jgi:hypothetical protein